jgi:hypothetical protein
MAGKTQGFLMAYVPDQAIDDQHEISLKAFLLFGFLCKHGSMKNNRVTVSLRTAADKYFKGNLQNCCIYYRELKSKKWITKDGSEIVLIKGFPAEMCIILNPEPVTITDQPDQEAGEVLNFNTKDADQVLNPNTLKVLNFNTKESHEVLNPNTKKVLNFNTPNNKVLTSHSNQPKERELNEERGEQSSSSAPQQIKPKILPVEKSEPIKLPDDFTITPELELWAKTVLPLLCEHSDLADLHQEFCEYWQSPERGDKAYKANRLAWIAAWKSDMTRKQQFLKRDLIAAEKPKKEKKDGSGKQPKTTGSTNGIQPDGDRQSEKTAGDIASKYGAKPAGIV